MATDPLNAHLITRVGDGQGTVSVEWHHDEDTSIEVRFVVVAVPAVGWRFSHWMMKSQFASDYYRTVGNPYAYYLTPTGSYSEVVFEAYFEIDPDYPPSPPEYTISVSGSPSGGGTATGGGTYAGGATCTISATAASGYHFTKWVCSDGREITDASYTFAVSASLTFTAQFEEGTGMPLYDATAGTIMFGSNGEILFDG